MHLQFKNKKETNNIPINLPRDHAYGWRHALSPKKKKRGKTKKKIKIKKKKSPEKGEKGKKRKKKVKKRQRQKKVKENTTESHQLTFSNPARRECLPRRSF